MTQIPHAEKGKTCPLNQKDCSTVCHKCPWWTKLVGKNPQSDMPIDEWACAVAFLPILLIENAQQSRQTGAAVESFRNEMVLANVNSINALVGVARNSPRLIDSQ